MDMQIIRIWKQLRIMPKYFEMLQTFLHLTHEHIETHNYLNYFPTKIEMSNVHSVECVNLTELPI